MSNVNVININTSLKVTLVTKLCSDFLNALYFTNRTNLIVCLHVMYKNWLIKKEPTPNTPINVGVYQIFCQGKEDEALFAWATS